jgi:hypothetical protein
MSVLTRDQAMFSVDLEQQQTRHLEQQTSPMLERGLGEMTSSYHSI